MLRAIVEYFFPPRRAQVVIHGWDGTTRYTPRDGRVVINANGQLIVDGHVVATHSCDYRVWETVDEPFRADEAGGYNAVFIGPEGGRAPGA